MASSSGTDPTTLIALGVIGFAAFQYAKRTPGLRTVAAPNQAQGATNRSAQPQNPVQVPQQGAPATTDGTPAAAPPPGATLVQQYNEQHTDGWYQVNQWSDGSYTFTGIPPDQYAAYGIPQPGTPPAVAPDPIVSNSWDAQTGNPAVSPDGSNATVIYAPAGPVYGPGPVYGQAGAPSTPFNQAIAWLSSLPGLISQPSNVDPAAAAAAYGVPLQ